MWRSINTAVGRIDRPVQSKFAAADFAEFLNAKVLRRYVKIQLNYHVDVINTLPAVQSAYRRYHSTETVLTKVVSDITMAADSGDVSVLALLDLSAEFDTVDHSILIQHLHISHHVKGTVLCWFESYLHERYQAVTYAGITAPATMVAHDVPQGLVLGPLLFIMYTADIPCWSSADMYLLC